MPARMAIPLYVAGYIPLQQGGRVVEMSECVPPIMHTVVLVDPVFHHLHL